MLSPGVYKELDRFKLSFKDDLYSEKFYESLYDLKDLSDYYIYCNPLEKLQFGTNIKIICARVLKYIETIYKKLYNQDDPYDVCLLLNYWVYSRLFSILQYNGENYVNQVYGQLQPIWTGFLEDKHYDKLCKPITHMVSHDDWRERMELYEYYVDYSPIKKSLVYFPERCEEFYHYVESKKTLYEHFKKRCTSSEENICPKFYKDCIKYNPENVLSTFSCQQKILDKRAADSARVSLNGGTFASSETDSEDTDGPMKPDDAPKLSGNPHTVTKLGNVLLGVVATSMTSGALYRFTPLGGMIRNGLGWNNNNMRNFNEGDIGLYDYTSESFNPYPGEEHYIGYHPA